MLPNNFLSAASRAFTAINLSGNGPESRSQSTFEDLKTPISPPPGPPGQLAASASRSHQINSKQFNCHARACSGPFGRHPDSRLTPVDPETGLSLIRRHPNPPPDRVEYQQWLHLVLELSRALSAQNQPRICPRTGRTSSGTTNGKTLPSQRGTRPNLR